MLNMIFFSITNNRRDMGLSSITNEHIRLDAVSASTTRGHASLRNLFSYWFILMYFIILEKYLVIIKND